MRRRRVPLAAVSVTLLAVAAAGCGSSSTPGAASSTPTGPAPGSSAPAGGAPSTTTGTPDTPATSAPGTTGGPHPSAAGPTVSVAHTGTPRCTVTDLRMRLGRGDPGAGNIYYPLEFTNKSGHACTLNGFPGVSLLRGDGSVIGRPADREGAKGLAVRLAPGQTVEADLHTLNNGVKDGGCWRAPTLMMVYPPGSTDAMTLAIPNPVVCGDTFEVGAVH